MLNHFTNFFTLTLHEVVDAYTAFPGRFHNWRAQRIMNHGDFNNPGTEFYHL